MEKFEINNDNVELFSTFVSRAKNVFSVLIETIKTSIKDYEHKIEDTTKEIDANEQSREKCEQEITKMESKIDAIKDVIENVESTYKKIADAYSSTSKGETKELYSEIIAGAKANCEKDVEKNRSEIARLNSDIEAIKNNISEFSKIIDELNKDLESYNLELFKYNKTLEYFEAVTEKANTDLDDISNKKDMGKKSDSKVTKRGDVKRNSIAKTEEQIIDRKENKVETNKTLIDSLKQDSLVNKQSINDKENSKLSEEKNEPNNLEASLKQIYNFNGYQSKEEPKEQEEVNTQDIEIPTLDFDFGVASSDIKPSSKNEPAYTDNLESLFNSNTPDIKEDNSATPFLDSDFANWENILNSSSEVNSANETNSRENEDTANQLLAPYGSSYARLKELISGTITKKDDTSVSFVMTTDDVIKAVNAIDGNDLKQMKTVGPEITLLRKIKSMKEGNL